VAKTSTTTLKLPDTLKARIAKVAKKSGRAPHAVMVEALERQIQREERMAAFVQEALDADREIDEGADVYRSEDVHAWLDRLVAREKPVRPKPWRA
jgi:predicted transcriptional regulator